MLFNKPAEDPNVDTIVKEIWVVVKRSGRSGFNAVIEFHCENGTWEQRQKSYPRMSVGQVRAAMHKFKQELVAKGQPKHSIHISYV